MENQKDPQDLHREELERATAQNFLKMPNKINRLASWVTIVANYGTISRNSKVL